MNFVDWIIIIFVAIFVVNGVRRGFLRGIAGFLGLVVALVLAVQFMDELSSILLYFFSLSPQVAVLLTAVIIFVIVLAAFILAAKFLRAVLNFAALGWLDRFAGSLLGLLKGAVVVSILALILSLIPFQGRLQSELHNSALFAPATKVAPAVFNLLVKAVPIAGSFYGELRQSLTGRAGEISLEAMEWLESFRKESSGSSSIQQ